MVTQSQLKVDLKKIGCKLKSQMNGDWAICEPKGSRVIVKSLEEVREYYLSKTSGILKAPNTGSVENVESESDVTEANQSLDSAVTKVNQAFDPEIAATQVRPVPEEIKQVIAATQVKPVPEELKKSIAPTQVKPVPDKIKSQAQQPNPKKIIPNLKAASETPDKSQVKENLKKIGCKLKSQMNGSWAIFEPKGNRIIVSGLDEVHRYYLSKTGGASAGSQSQVKSQVKSAPKQAPVDPNQTVEMPATQPNKITRSSNAIKSSAELSKAIEKANHVINLLKERRLKRGINVTRTDLRNNILTKVCSDELMDDVMRYVETRFDKDCLDRVMVKRHFKNHLGEDDAMYFDIRYASLLVNTE